MTRYWKGDKSIWKTALLLWLGGTITISLIGAILAGIGATSLGYPPYQIAFFSFMILSLINPFFVFAWVSVWRSAGNNKRPVLVTFRGMVAAHIVFVAYCLLMVATGGHEWLLTKG